MSYNHILIEEKIKDFLKEDCMFSDVSSNIIPEKPSVSAKIIAKSGGFISGLEEIKILFNLLNVDVNLRKKDGMEVTKGDIVLELKGSPRKILLGERIGLNLLTHMSAITTTVKKYLKIVSNSGKNVKIACTRKTLPGLRIFEKKAVSLAGLGADTHRFSLDDMVLLKDTHLRYYNGDVERLLKDVKKRISFTKKIEIEIEKIEDVLIAARNGADILMLDNMKPEQVEKALNLLIKNDLRGKVIVEISGGISMENIMLYLKAEPDVISMGNLTLFPSEQVDLSLKFD
jgi:nicotinate-nucleotide pyrophosphorylase (carboxylating)